MKSIEIRTSDLADAQVKLEQIQANRQDLPVIFAISGLSEAGKSHFSLYLEKLHHSLRFKIYYEIGAYLRLNYPELDELNTFEACHLFTEYKEQLTAAYRYAIKKYKEQISSTTSSLATIESLKHLWILKLLEQESDVFVVSIFITAPLENRIKNEAKKVAMSEKVIRLQTLEKDRLKEKYGVSSIMGESNIILNNDSGIQEYERCIEHLLDVFMLA